jgi:hypothetical protein
MDRVCSDRMRATCVGALCECPYLMKTDLGPGSNLGGCPVDNVANIANVVGSIPVAYIYIFNLTSIIHPFS